MLGHVILVGLVGGHVIGLVVVVVVVVVVEDRRERGMDTYI